ncbi:capsular polysaccharide synthesis protein [Paracoccus methylarcula]|uniref:Mannosyltransferase n=1 Tax=Paracoccus methylarcula TaxID=72022 RepID=A0A3R7M758_9RHOB|nr:capsular polysaccharide synthesis protein [Paracoccus methylarcula]RNF32877.1 hypothetical protein A7A09_019570 [Paracoccus methylarcula]
MTLAKALPKTIWTVWHDWSVAPSVTAMSLASWRSMNPDWELQALSAEDIPGLLGVDAAQRILDIRKCRAHQSDMLRVELLYQFGGVWADSTTLCARPLDEWLGEVMQQDYFAFCRPEEERPMATWFQASLSRGYIIAKLRDSYERYWHGRDREDDYYWPHKLFSDLIRTDKVFNEIWRNVPQVSAMHRFHFSPGDSGRLGAAPTPEDLSSDIEKKAPVWKLTHKGTGSLGSTSLMRYLSDKARRRSSKRRLVLHVGLPKTATTTIQMWADRMRPELARHDIWYPFTPPRLDHPKHQQLIWALVDGKFDQVPDVLDPAGCQTLFLSAEGLTAHLIDFDESNLSCLREMIKDYDVRIFINRRKESDWLTSYYQQFVVNPPNDRFGYATSLSLSDFKELPRVRALTDSNLLNRLADTFNASEVVESNLASDWPLALCRLLGAPELSNRLLSERPQNVGLSPSSVEVMRQINEMRVSGRSRGFILSVLREFDSMTIAKASSNKFSCRDPLAPARAGIPEEQISTTISHLKGKARWSGAPFGEFVQFLESTQESCKQ